MREQLLAETKQVHGGAKLVEIIHDIVLVRDIYIQIAQSVSGTPQNFLSATKIYKEMGMEISKVVFEILHSDLRQNFNRGANIR